MLSSIRNRLILIGAHRGRLPFRAVPARGDDARARRRRGDARQHRTRDPDPPRARPAGRDAPRPRARPVEAGLVRRDPRHRPRAHGAAQAHRRVRRHGAEDPEVRRRPHRRRARRHRPTRRAPRNRPAERLPRVPHHQQDERLREGAAGHGPRAAGARREQHRGGAAQPRPSAVAELLGGTDSTRRDSARRPTARPPTAPRRHADTTILPGGALSSLIEPSGAMPG